MATKNNTIITVKVQGIMHIVAKIIITSSFENHGNVASEVHHMCFLVLGADSLEGIPVPESLHMNSQC
jgi:hypothetical protein